VDEDEHELERRVAVLEGILGMDPLDGCNGDPLTCEADCSNETCPLTSNPVSHLRDEVSLLRRENRVLRSVLGNLEKQGMVPPVVRERANLQVDLQDLTVNLNLAQQTYQQMSRMGFVGNIKGEVAERIRKLQAEIKQLQSILEVGSLDIAPGGRS